MSLRLSDLTKRLFRRYTKKAAPARNVYRFRPTLEGFEDRTVPAVVSLVATSDAPEGSTAGIFGFERTGDTTAALTVGYTVSGTATSGTDFDTLSGSFTFAAYDANAFVNVWAYSDGVVDAGETVTLTLASGSGYTVGAGATGTITILDDSPTVTVAQMMDTPEGGMMGGAFTLTRTGNASASLTVGYTVGGTATSGDDYTALTGTVTFAASSYTATVYVSAIDDSTSEPTETVVLTLTSGTSYVVGTPASATVNVLNNAVPTANDDSVTGYEDTQLTGNVLTNDADPDGDTLTATLVDGVWFGTLTLNADGSFTYTPDADYSGEDRFTYSISDGHGHTATAAVTLTVAPVDDDPIIEDQSFTISENLPDGTIVGFVVARDPDSSQILTYSITAGNSSGAFAIDAVTGAITVADSSALDYESVTTFSLTILVTDNGATPRTDTATVDIDIENLAEDPQETEADRITWLNGKYLTLQGALASLDPANAGNDSGKVLDRLGQLLALTDSLNTDIDGPDAVGYRNDLKSYRLGMENIFANGTFDNVVLESSIAIADAAQLIQYSEGDKFRIQGVVGLLSRLDGRAGTRDGLMADRLVARAVEIDAPIGPHLGEEVPAVAADRLEVRLAGTPGRSTRPGARSHAPRL